MSAVRNSPARPRTPSVPNNRRVLTASVPTMGRRLALRELRTLAGLLEACLLALHLARVAREVAAALQLGAERGLGLDERTGDPVAQRAGLGGDAATVDARDDVHAREVAGRLERLARLRLQTGPREVDLELLAVDRVDAAAGLQHDARDRGLALAGGLVAGIGGQLERGARGRDGLTVDGLAVGRLLAILGHGVLRILVALTLAARLVE